MSDRKILVIAACVGAMFYIPALMYLFRISMWLPHIDSVAPKTDWQGCLAYILVPIMAVLIERACMNGKSVTR